MDLELFDLLVSSGCPPSLYRRFAGLTKQQLMNMPLPQVNAKLREILPLELSQDRLGVIRSIINALQSAAEVEHQSEQLEPPNTSAIKQEIPDMDDQPHSSVSPATKIEEDDGGNRDIKIVGEVTNGEVTFIGRKLKEQAEVLLLEVDDLEDEQSSPSAVPGPSSSSSRKRKILDPIYIRLSAQHVQKRREVSKKTVGSSLEFTWDSVNLGQLETQRKKIYSLECESWTWKEKCSTDTTLFEIIKPGGPCSGISELIILSNPLQGVRGRSPCQLDLPNLTRLTAHQKGKDKINYTQLLICIMQASKLEEIEFSAETEFGISAFLQILAKSAPNLAGLKKLSLRNDLALVALSNTEIISLSQMQFVGLEELNLDFSLSADVKLEPLLANFAPSLKIIKVAGCYTTDASVEPQVQVDVPHMPCLEVLDFGHGERFRGNFETTDRRPPKRKSRSFRVEPQTDSDASVVPPVTTPPTNTTAVGMFKVSLSLPTLPKLRTLNLSSYFALQGFHFSLFPALENFQVSSDWHLALPNKPIPVSERKVYNKLKILRFPDRLVDHTFMHKIPVFFPNLETLILCYPSVKVLRALAKTMKDVKSFKRLRVYTQFDFASSLDYCFLPNSTKFCQTEEEIQKVETLKDYKHHQDYVAEYHIQLPAFDADGEEFEGLGVLKEKFISPGSSFLFHQISRTLRLPKGNYHWNDDRCEFTDTLIGFKRMPISNVAFEQFPPDFDHVGLEHPKLRKVAYIPPKMNRSTFLTTEENPLFVKKDEVAQN